MQGTAAVFLSRHDMVPAVGPLKRTVPRGHAASMNPAHQTILHAKHPQLAAKLITLLSSLSVSLFRLPLAERKGSHLSSVMARLRRWW